MLPRKNWDDWLSRVSAHKTTDADINDNVVIPMLLSHFRVNDKRIIGRSEAKKDAEALNKKITLEDVLAHVKKWWSQLEHSDNPQQGNCYKLQQSLITL